MDNFVSDSVILYRVVAVRDERATEMVLVWKGSVYIATPLGGKSRLLVVNGEPRRSQATEVLCLHRSLLPSERERIGRVN